jgi:2-keto-3-deoxy-L-rhamnonate aldolase RhmA
MPRSNAKAPVDPGVRIFFESKHGALAYQSDSCDYWQHNVRSVALGLGALRAVDRYGITKKAEQYAGWRQIESAKPDYWSAMQTLAELAGIDGVGSGSGDVAKAYRIAARRHHPDTGGTVEMWHLLQDIAVTLGVNS